MTPLERFIEGFNECPRKKTFFSNIDDELFYFLHSYMDEIGLYIYDEDYGGEIVNVEALKNSSGLFMIECHDQEFLLSKTSNYYRKKVIDGVLEDLKNNPE